MRPSLPVVQGNLEKDYPDDLRIKELQKLDFQGVPVTLRSRREKSFIAFKVASSVYDNILNSQYSKRRRDVMGTTKKPPSMQQSNSSIMGSSSISGLSLGKDTSSLSQFITNTASTDSSGISSILTTQPSTLSQAASLQPGIAGDLSQLPISEGGSLTETVKGMSARKKK